MKKIKICIFLTILSGVASSAFALNDVSISGEMDVVATLHNLPTRDQGTLAFSIPSLLLDVEGPLKEGNEFFVQLESSENRDATSKRYNTQLRKGYLSLTSFLSPQSEVRLGLIPDFWVEIEKEGWDYSFWGVNSYLPMIRYKYSSWSDLGVMYQTEFGDDWGLWAISASNGEGLDSDELGARKEFQILAGITKAAPIYFVISYVQGAYDLYDNSFNAKTRLLTHLSYEADRGTLALEYYQTKDPANAMTTLGIAGGVDVTALAGTSVSGQGASLFGKLKVSQKWALFARGDSLNPVKSDSKKNLQAVMAGTSYELTSDVMMALSYDSTQYGEQFSVSPRDVSRFVFATRAVF